MNKQQVKNQLERVKNAKPTKIQKGLKESLEQKLQDLEGKTVNK